MHYFFKNNRKKELLLLTIIYFLAHWLLLVVSGRWWDDWVLVNPNHDVIVRIGLESGRPEYLFFTDLARALPEKGYRIIVFFAFFFCMLCTYRVLRAWLRINDQECFIISALYAIIPANDARIMLCVFDYSLGLFFFMEGFALLSEKMDDDGKIRTKDRILCLLLFFASYMLNSNLVFYALVLLMILTRVKSIAKMLKYIDFIVLPVVYYVLNNLLFPVHGAYENYNNVSYEKLIAAIWNTPIAACKCIVDVFRNIFELPRVVLIGTLFIGILTTAVLYALTFYREERVVDKEYMLDSLSNECILNNVESRWRSFFASCGVKTLILGAMALLVGLFPYVVIRNGSNIYTVGTSGRDSFLIALGAALLIFEIIHLIMKRWPGNALLCFIVVGGILFFNIQYLSYQQDHYRKLGYQYQLSQHEELRDCSNILYLNSDPGRINIHTWYAMNAVVNRVYGNQNKVIATSVSVAKTLEQEQFKSMHKSEEYYMADYEPGDMHFDAITDYSMEISLGDTIKMLLYELTGNMKFDDWLTNRSRMNVYMYGEDDYFAIMNSE